MQNLPSFAPYNQRSSVVKIVGYQGKRLQGFLQNPHYQEEQYFDNFVQFLLLMDSLCDDINFPRKGTEDRAFVKVPEAERSFMCDTPNTGKPLATFKISVLFRQNSSWQGNIAWMEQESEAQFRSTLELAKLIDSVLVSVEK